MIRHSVQIGEILQSFPDLLSLIRGTQDALVDQIQTGRLATTQSLVFISKSDQAREAQEGQSQTWVVPKGMADQVPAQVRTVIESPNPYLAMAKVGAKYFPERQGDQIVGEMRIHPRAVVADSAQVGAGCRVGPGAVIGENVEIGENCVIGANTVIEPNVKIGAETRLHPLVHIAHDCVIGARCEIKSNTSIGGEGYGYAHDQAFNHYRITHYGRVVIGDDVHIGSGVQMDRGTFEDSHIARGVRIDNHCHFGHNIRVGENTLITAGMITGGSTTIGANCVFGGRVTIKGHLSIADRSQFGGISGIGNNVLKSGEYGGLPLQPVKDEMKTRASLKEVPALVKKVRRILKHLGLDEKSTPTPADRAPEI